MNEFVRNPLIDSPPHAAHWRRATRRRYGSAAERQDALVVLHALAGEAQYLIDDRVVSLRPGALLWALSGQAHVFLSDTPDFDMWVFVVAPHLLPPGGPPAALEMVAEAPRLRVLPLAAMAELDQIARALETVEDIALRRAGYLWWLTRAWQHRQASPLGRQNAVHPAVERAARLLETDPETPLDQLARAAGLSAGRLSQVFKAQTGQGITAFRTELRLARVDRIMETAVRPDLLGAALDAGFGSYSQFYRAFRQHRGTAPRAFYANAGT